jgi:hypothetical protein
VCDALRFLAVGRFLFSGKGYPSASPVPGCEYGHNISCQRGAAMKKEQILGIVRHVAGFAGAYLVASGKVDEATMQEAVGAVLAVAAVVWSLYAKTTQG